MELVKTFLLSRATQILVKLAMGGLAFLAAMINFAPAPDALAQQQTFWAALIGSGLCFIWDVVTHRIKYGAWIHHTGDGDGGGGGYMFPPQGGAPFIGGMKPLLNVLLILVFFLPLLGGCSYTQAGRTIDSINACALANQQKRDAIDEGFIADYRTNARAQADALADAALKAETDAAGKASAKNIQLVLEKKAEHYALIEATVVSMRMKIIAANLDMANLLSYNAQLKNYFKQQADNGQLLNSSSTQIVGMLSTFLQGKKASAIPTP
jgi:hypothetical protein